MRAGRCRTGDEPHRRRCVRIRPWCVRNVVQRLPAFGFQTHQGQPLENFAQPGEPAPRLRVRGARGTEGREIAHHQFVYCQPFPARLAEPSRRGGQPHLSAALPKCPWRYLYQRQQAACGLGKRAWRRVRPLLGQPGTDLAGGERLGVEKPLGRVDDRRHVDGCQRPAVCGVGPQHAIQCRLDKRAQPMAVLGGDEVDGAAHQHDPNGLAGGEQAGQLVAGEAVEATPQPRSTARTVPAPACRRGARPRRARSSASAAAATGGRVWPGSVPAATPPSTGQRGFE